MVCYTKRPGGSIYNRNSIALPLPKMIKRCLLIILISVILVIITAIVVPYLLISSGDPVPADAILYLAIDPYSKSDDYVAELYRRKAAPRIVCAGSQVSHQVFQSDFTREHLIKLGVPESSVESLHLPITDCLGESSDFMRDYIRQRGWKRVLVVVNPGGSRYAGWILRNRLEPAGIAVGVTYNPEIYSELNDRWWMTHWKAQIMVESLIGPALDVWYRECR